MIVMIHSLERRLRRLESLLPPLLSENVSWISGLLWFAIGYYLGNPAPNEKPFAAFARALGYANESELNSVIEKNHRDLSNRLRSAEDRALAKFGIFVSSLEDGEFDDAYNARFWENLKRMYAGLPRSYKKQLNRMVLVEMIDLAWMRIYYSDNPGRYLRCFA
jgi:hypothetical protein